KYPLPYYKMAQIYARQGRARDAEAARRKFSALGNLREEEILTRQTLDDLIPAARLRHAKRPAIAATRFPDMTRLRHRRSREMASEVRRCQREGRPGRSQRLGRR